MSSSFSYSHGNATGLGPNTKAKRSRIGFVQQGFLQSGANVTSWYQRTRGCRCRTVVLKVSGAKPSLSGTEQANHRFAGIMRLVLVHSFGFHGFCELNCSLKAGAVSFCERRCGDDVCPSFVPLPRNV